MPQYWALYSSLSMYHHLDIAYLHYHFYNYLYTQNLVKSLMFASFLIVFLR